MSAIINPSKNEAAARQRAQFGYVVRVPVLPLADEKMNLLVVFQESDKCFYKCESYIQNGRTFYRWNAVTTGGSRAFLIPVEKMAVVIDPTEEESKESFTAMINTVDQIAVGLQRYDVVVQPLGWTKTADKVYLDEKTYYKWNPAYSWDTLLENGIQTRMFVEMVKGVDYNVGDTIQGLVYEFNGSEPYESLTYEKVVKKINEIIEILNRHNAGIPYASTDYTLYQNSVIVNLIIDEINPFSDFIDRFYEIEKKIKHDGSLAHPLLFPMYIKKPLDGVTRIYKLDIYDDDDGKGIDTSRLPEGETPAEDAFVVNGPFYVQTNGNVYKLDVYDDPEQGMGLDITKVEME